MADTLAESQARYRDALDASREQRTQIEEDLRFSDPSDPQQWDEREKQSRMADPGGARPCLVMDQTGQFIANVAGQVEQRPPALHAIPAGDGAMGRVAEQLDGFYRHIEHSSRAQQHYARALTSAARAGVGYIIVRPEVTDRPLKFQEPRIGSEGDPLRVVFDPWSVELDGSDATDSWLLTPYSHREFERQFGAKAEKVSFGDEEGRRCDERESINVAEQWSVQDRTQNMIVVTGPQGDEMSLTEDDYHIAQQGPQPPTFVRTYKDKYRCVKWSRMSGAGILTPEAEFPASGVGIVPVYGYVSWVEGRMKYCGIARRAREPQRAYNFHQSEIRALVQQAPKSPWMVPRSAIQSKTQQALWDRASVDSRAYLVYEDWDPVNNRPVPPPTRTPNAVNLQNHIQGALAAREDIQAALGMYAANIGRQSNAQSGVAYDAQKEQGEASTAHFPSHLAASLGQVGKLVLDMIPRLIDTRRQLRILGIDNKPSTITVDPKQSEALRETPQGLSINPNVGKYDVRSVVGPSFNTQRQETQAELREMMRANPALTPAIAPLWAQTLDVPHADKLAQVLTAMAPDPVKAILQPDQQEDTATLKAKLDQMNQALQEAIHHAKEAQQELDEAHAQLQQSSADSEAKEDEISVKAFDAWTKRLQVMGTTLTPEAVAAIAQQTALGVLAQPQPGEEPTEGADAPQVAMGPAQAMPMQPAAPGQPQPGGSPLGAPPVSEGAPAGEVGAAEPPELGAAPAQPEGPTPAEHELMQGQEHLAQMLEALIRTLAAPRRKVPHRNPAGDIVHVDEFPVAQEQAQ